MIEIPSMLGSHQQNNPSPPRRARSGRDFKEILIRLQLSDKASAEKDVNTSTTPLLSPFLSASLQYVSAKSVLSKLMPAPVTVATTLRRPLNPNVIGVRNTHVLPHPAVHPPLEVSGRILQNPKLPLSTSMPDLPYSTTQVVLGGSLKDADKWSLLHLHPQGGLGGSLKNADKRTLALLSWKSISFLPAGYGSQFLVEDRLYPFGMIAGQYLSEIKLGGNVLGTPPVELIDMSSLVRKSSHLAAPTHLSTLTYGKVHETVVNPEILSNSNELIRSRSKPDIPLPQARTQTLIAGQSGTAQWLSRLLRIVPDLRGSVTLWIRDYQLAPEDALYVAMQARQEAEMSGHVIRRVYVNARPVWSAEAHPGSSKNGGKNYAY